MDRINLTEKTDWAFIEEVKKESGENPSLCYQSLSGFVLPVSAAPPDVPVMSM
jgi:hypothetical protein